MSGWRCLHIGFYGDDVAINGVRLWAEEWRLAEAEQVRLPHPAFPTQMNLYNTWEIGDPDRPVMFAATELSAGVWGFYVPEP